MLRGAWGRKIGMTQVFSEKNAVIPVTVINLADWLVTNIKTKERDGYDAVQVGCLRERYANESFSTDWLKQPKKYFNYLREIRLSDPADSFELGKQVDFATIWNQ